MSFLDGMLSAQLLEKLRCDNCHSYLSVLPVNSYGGERTVCGRCPVEPSFCPHEEKLYAEITSGITFPCQYDMLGCLEKLTPAEMKLHEPNCSFRPIRCPFLSGACEYQESYEILYEHYVAHHNAYIFNNVKLVLDEDSERNYMLQYKEHFFVIHYKCEEDQLYFEVSYSGKQRLVDKFGYKLKFTSPDHVSFHQNGNLVTSENFGNINMKACLAVPLNDLKINLGEPTSIFCSIKFFEKEEDEIILPEHNVDILQQLECPVCLMYMQPPILLCERGHSFCNECHAKLKLCPLCKGSMLTTQNFQLEKISEKINYPCKYKEFGCKFYGKTAELKQHEPNCVTSGFSCFFNNCKWKSKFNNLLPHIKEYHFEDYLQMNTITYLFIPPVNETIIYAVYKFMNIFKVVQVVNDEYFKFTVQLVGPDFGKYEQYMWELDFKGDDGERIYYKKHCGQLKAHKELIDIANEDNTVTLLVTDLTNFIVDETVTFSINIVELF